MKILHTMLRVGDIDRSVAFYSEVLGMQELSRKDYPHGEFTLVFLGYGPKETHPTIELTFNWGVDSYDIGNGYGHVALEVDDLYATCDSIRDKGGKITREPGPMKGSGHSIAFCEDPDGYKIELIEKLP